VTGRATLEEWSALQWALVSAAVAATAVVVRVWPDPWWSHDARRSLIPGAALALGLTLLLDGAAGWSAGPLVFVGLATLVTSEALADRLGVTLTQAIQAPLLWLALAGLQLRAGDGWTGPVAVVAALALLEWQDRRRPGAIPVLGACVGVVAGIVLAVRVEASDPWSAVAAVGVLAAWAHVHRLWPLTSLTSYEGRLAVAGIAALAPAGVAAALVGALPDGVAFIALGFVALLVAGAIRGMSPADPFLGPWAFVSTAALGGTVALWPLSADAAAVALGTSSVAVGVVPGQQRHVVEDARDVRVRYAGRSHQPVHYDVPGVVLRHDRVRGRLVLRDEEAGGVLDARLEVIRHGRPLGPVEDEVAVVPPGHDAVLGHRPLVRGVDVGCGGRVVPDPQGGVVPAFRDRQGGGRHVVRGGQGLKQQQEGKHGDPGQRGRRPGLTAPGRSLRPAFLPAEPGDELVKPCDIRHPGDAEAGEDGHVDAEQVDEPGL
jgi:hypothetical protein